VFLKLSHRQKFQKRLVMVPADYRVKVTINGLSPVVGLPTKSATWTKAPVPTDGIAAATIRFRC